MQVIVVEENGTPHKLMRNYKPVFKIFARRFNNGCSVLASPDGDLFNPLDSSCNLNKKDNKIGGMFWKLRSCSYECYRQYTIFLRTKNRTPYLMAQRRFRSDF